MKNLFLEDNYKANESLLNSLIADNEVAFYFVKVVNTNNERVYFSTDKFSDLIFLKLCQLIKQRFNLSTNFSATQELFAILIRFYGNKKWQNHPLAPYAQKHNTLHMHLQ